jgi:hypothetical protein
MATAKPKIPETVFRSWEDFPADLWRWPNFSPLEMACKGDGRLMIHAPSLDRLQALRTRIGKPMIVHSAFRTREYNRRVGGAAGSMHLAARAFDIGMANHDPHEFEAAARACGFTGFGFYPDSGFMHIDTGPARWWGDRWPAYEDEPPAPPAMAGALAQPDPEDARAGIIGQLQQVFGGKIANPLKRKRAAA